MDFHKTKSTTTRNEDKKEMNRTSSFSLKGETVNNGG